MPLLNNFKWLRASSVLESVIAISIISICSLVAFTIYLNVIKQNDSTRYFNAKHKVNLLVQQIIVTNQYEDDFYNYEGYTIDKTVSINKTKNIAFLTFTLKIADNKTYVFNKVIPYNDQ